MKNMLWFLVFGLYVVLVVGCSSKSVDDNSLKTSAVVFDNGDSCGCGCVDDCACRKNGICTCCGGNKCNCKK